MDELQISGKRFISSRRIAKENGYHTDYIGQLIRGGKIKGQKVGRAWYVEADSFATYLGSAVAVESAPEQSSDLGYADSVATESAEVLVPSHSQPPISEIAPTQTPGASEVAVVADAKQTTEAISEIAPAPAVIPVEVETVEIKKVEAIKPIHVGLRYVRDAEPLLPEIRPQFEVSRKVAALAPVEAAPEVHAKNAPRPKHSKVHLIPVFIVGAAVFAICAYVSSTLVQNINIQAGNPASVSYALPW